jgi:hypothetical protein
MFITILKDFESSRVNALLDITELTLDYSIEKALESQLAIFKNHIQNGYDDQHYDKGTVFYGGLYCRIESFEDCEISKLEEIVKAFHQITSSDEDFREIENYTQFKKLFKKHNLDAEHLKEFYKKLKGA